MDFKSDFQLAFDTEVRQRRVPPSTSVFDVDYVSPEEFKLIKARGETTGVEFNRIIATARVLAKGIFNRLRPFDVQDDEVGDPYGELVGWDCVLSKQDAVYLHRLMTFITKE